jgi:hypothetical protein
MKMRAPDFIVGDPAAPYLRRWWIIPRNRWFNVYLHHFLRSDDDRALHDHPWWNVSILLRGEYLEHMPGGVVKRRRPGVPVLRSAEAAHRVELIGGYPVWSLFITGPRIREWGFHCSKGWKHWRDFVAPGTGAGTGGSQTGQGCDE